MPINPYDQQMKVMAPQTTMSPVPVGAQSFGGGTAPAPQAVPPVMPGAVNNPNMQPRDMVAHAVMNRMQNPNLANMPFNDLASAQQARQDWRAARPSFGPELSEEQRRQNLMNWFAARPGGGIRQPGAPMQPGFAGPNKNPMFRPDGY